MTILNDHFYLRSIDRRWKKELRDQASRVLVFSPYITPNTAESVLEGALPSQCEIYTVISAELFASGASSIQTLNKLLKSGYQIYSIDKLHAKIIVAGSSFASIGSQNLTGNGVRNREATIVVSDPSQVRFIVDKLEPWIRTRKKLTQEYLDELELHLPELRKMHEELQRQTKKVDEVVQAKIDLWDRQVTANAVRESLASLFVDGEVSEATAKEFIRKTLWWVDHPHGPCKVPRYSNRVQKINGEWSLKIGGNTFVVGNAVQWCRDTCDEFLKKYVQGSAWSKRYLIPEMKSRIQEAVLNANGDYYNGSYPISDGYLKFGSHGIDVNDFISEFTKRLTNLPG